MNTGNNTNICAKYQTNKVENIQQNHADALKRINTRVKPTADSVLTAKHIEEIFKIIDDVFFSKQIGKLLRSRGIELEFDVALRLTSTAGYFKKLSDKKHVLVISVPIMKQLFSNDEKRYELGGLQCSSKIECIYHVICHELIHFIASVECPELMTSQRGHNGIFKKMINNIFGHTNCHHSLHVDIDRKTRALDAIKTNFKIGDTVSFKYGKVLMRGQILSINNRVKIITSDKRMFYIGPMSIINDSGSDRAECLKKDPKCTTFKNVNDCGSNAGCSWSTKTNKCSKTRVCKKPQTRKQPSTLSAVSAAASGCSSYNAEPECIKSKYNCVWGKTKRCSKKRMRD
jgi:hypothetical protein